MGVIKNTSINTSANNSIEDVLSDLGSEQESSQQNQQQAVVERRPRKPKNRQPKPDAVGGINIVAGKSGKKKKRMDNSSFLLSLADSDEIYELNIQDFISPTVSVFTEFFIHQDQLAMWNDFLNCTQDKEEWFQKSVQRQGPKDDNQIVEYDQRMDRPAFVAMNQFHRIDGELRFLLKKKHLPLGALTHLEAELVHFFTSSPTSTYHCQIPNSFERLMMHALSQYMGLFSLSYNKRGMRWTKVKNKKSEFSTPPMLLSAFLEKKYTRNVCDYTAHD